MAEGWTEYYGNITLERTGIVTPAQYLGTLSEDLTYDLTRPARTWMSARASAVLFSYILSCSAQAFSELCRAAAWNAVASACGVGRGQRHGRGFVACRRRRGRG